MDSIADDPVLIRTVHDLIDVLRPIPLDRIEVVLVAFVVSLLTAQHDPIKALDALTADVREAVDAWIAMQVPPPGTRPS